MRSPAFSFVPGEDWIPPGSGSELDPEPDPEPEPELDIILQGEQNYTAILTMSEELKPQTVVADNFTLYNAAKKLEIEEALYKPETKQVFLKLAETSLSSSSCTVKMNNVQSLTGATVSNPMAIDVQSEHFCNMFGMSVKSIQLFHGSEQVINPVKGEALSIVVTVVNAGNSAKSGTLRVYLSDSPESDLCDTKSITLEKGFMDSYRFDLPGGIVDGQTGTICSEII